MITKSRRQGSKRSSIAGIRYDGKLGRNVSCRRVENMVCGEMDAALHEKQCFLSLGPYVPPSLILFLFSSLNFLSRVRSFNSSFPFFPYFSVTVT